MLAKREDEGRGGLPLTASLLNEAVRGGCVRLLPVLPVSLNSPARGPDSSLHVSPFLICVPRAAFFRLRSHIISRYRCDLRQLPDPLLCFLLRTSALQSKRKKKQESTHTSMWAHMLGACHPLHYEATQRSYGCFCCRSEELVLLKRDHLSPVVRLWER